MKSSRSRENPDDTLVDRFLGCATDDLVGDLAVFEEQEQEYLVRHSEREYGCSGQRSTSELSACLRSLLLLPLQLAPPPYTAHTTRPRNLPGPAAGTSTHHC